MKENGFKLAKERNRRYSAGTITDVNYTDDIVLLTNTPAQDETLLHSLERAAVGTDSRVNTDKTENMCFYQRGNISTLKLVDKFTYHGSNVSLTENDIKSRLAKAWTAIDRLSVIWKSHLNDKITVLFPNSGYVNTALWMHHMDANEAFGEKAWRQLHKNASNSIEQVPETTTQLLFSSAVRPPTTHHENHPNWTNQTCEVPLEK